MSAGYDDPYPDDDYDDEPDCDYDPDDDYYEPGEPDWDYVEYQRWCSLSPLARLREHVRDFIRCRVPNWRLKRNERNAGPFSEDPPF